MEYQILFEITDFKWQVYLFPFIGVIFIILATLTIRFPEKYIRLKDPTKSYIAPHILKVQIRTVRGFGIAIFLFALFLTTLAAGVLLKKQHKLREAYRNDKYKIVEGYVQNFSPMPYSGQHEIFTINGITFKYSDYKVSPAFNTTKSHGGPVEEGAYLRISYVCNDIIKLEKRK
jgi:multisubunit Na+/H+ antiporter MnhG subunit